MLARAPRDSHDSQHLISSRPPKLAPGTTSLPPILNIQLLTQEIAPQPGFAESTLLLSSQVAFKSHQILALVAPGVAKHESVSGLFNDVPHSEDGWILELAAELPSLLPALNGLSECVIEVNAAPGNIKKLCLSNRMSRLHYSDGGEAWHALIPRTAPWHGSIDIKNPAGKELHAAEEQLGTFASMRFTIKGANAESALEAEIEKCAGALIAAINSVLVAFRDTASTSSHIPRSVGWNSLPPLYMHLQGKGAGRFARLSLTTWRAALTVETIADAKLDKFRDIVSGKTTITDVERFVGYARSSWQSGEYEFAFLQAVIAAEIQTTRIIYLQCKANGISETKLDEHKSDLTYSLGLDICLKLGFPQELLPPAELINAMTEARRKRNSLMHSALFDWDRDKIFRLIEDTARYVHHFQEKVAPTLNASSSPAR